MPPQRPVRIDDRRGHCDASTLHGRYITAYTGTVDLEVDLSAGSSGKWIQPPDGKGTMHPLLLGRVILRRQGKLYVTLHLKPWSGPQVTHPVFVGTIWETYEFREGTCLARRTDH